jgi:hypothetical protein
MAMYGIWVFASPGGVPPAVHHTVTTFSNIGGVLNLGVYLLIRRRMQVQETQTDHSSNQKRSGTKETSNTEL